jgi:uncharacterized membrane protein YphA (DoxX/SURF4 family)
MELILTGLNLPTVAITLLRVSMGVFFTISGYHKLFNAKRHAIIESTMESDGVPDPVAASWFIPFCEFAGGLALLIGFLTPLAAIGLCIICCGAALLDGLKRITGYAPIDKADYVDDVLYLPEVLYSIILLSLTLTGGGPISIDYLALHSPGDLIGILIIGAASTFIVFMTRYLYRLATED